MHAPAEAPAHPLVRAQLRRWPLPGTLPAERAALLVRGDAHPVALTGRWAGGGAIAGSEPLLVAEEDEDPFALLDAQPDLTGDDGPAWPGAVGGGWFGALRYGLGARVEAVPPGPPRPAPLPAASLAFHDHVVRCDLDGRWWFEALWTHERDEALARRRGVFSARLACATRVPLGPQLGRIALAPGAAEAHAAAVAACRERIAAGDLFQANLCLRLEGEAPTDPAALAARLAETLRPGYGAYLGGPWGALCGASPELFLRRSGRAVSTEPIKGTHADRATLEASAKDRAEHVMIVDLMRNDLGRVCAYGSVAVDELAAPRRAPGVWNLVSTVSGTLREDAGDADLLRATFPPGSVTGAPKVQALRVIAELERTGREGYTGAVGYASPVAGLELAVVIRSFEVAGDRVWLGAGGGITWGSDPAREVEECFAKAAPLVAAAGGTLDVPEVAAADSSPAVPDARAATAAPAVVDRPPDALTDGRQRPDAALGVFSTALVRDGAVVALGAHLARLGADAPAVEDEVREVAAKLPGTARARLTARTVRVEPFTPVLDAVALRAWTLPGGLGECKWADRRLVDALTAAGDGATPLLVDQDGAVLEAGWANVWILRGKMLLTPPADGRLLPGVTRARLLAGAAARAGYAAAEGPLTLDDLASADAVLLTSALRHAVAAIAPGARAPSPAAKPAARALRDALASADG